jgi:DNA repair photolyase
MSDPYVPPERAYNLTGQALELIRRHGLGAHICTKSDLVTRDVAVLAELARVRASVAFTVTTADDSLAAKVEPFAPPPSRRFAAMARLAEAGVITGTLMTPVLPFIEDTESNLVEIVERTAACGGRFVFSWYGMTLRDRQREYYYDRLDEHFPGLRAAYERRYGGRYGCEAPGAAALSTAVREACSRLRLITDMKEFGGAFPVRSPEQLRLF